MSLNKETQLNQNNLDAKTLFTQQHLMLGH